jgi:hypothetical protein
MIQAPIFHTTTSTSTLNYSRSRVANLGPSNLDGSVTYEVQIVASNTQTGTDGRVLIRTGTSSGSTQSLLISGSPASFIRVPKNTTTPTLYTATLTNSPASTVYFQLAIRNDVTGITNSKITIHSAKIIARQTNSNKSMTYIPLTTNGSTTSDIISTTSTATTSSMASPNDINFPAYRFVRSNFNNVTSASFIFVGRSTNYANVCASLWVKSTSLKLAESCTTSITEIFTTPINVDLSQLPNDGDIEVRLKTSSGTGHLFKAGLMMNYVGIYNHTNIELVTPSLTSLNSSSVINTHRFRSFANGYGLITPEHYLKCRVKTNTAGSAQINIKDYGTNTSSQTATSTISASTLNLSNQGLHIAVTSLS